MAINEKDTVQAQAQLEPLTVADVAADMAALPQLQHLADVEVPQALREAVEEEDLTHREFDETEFWRRLPAYARVSAEEFGDHRFQIHHSVSTFEALVDLVGEVVSPAFLADVKRGLEQAPMNLRLSPYLLALINWRRPYSDPVRLQFIPVASQRVPDHPRLTLDALHERADSPTPGLVHRYPGKVLFLATDVCPAYCRFCTRSYAIGGDTSSVCKTRYRPQARRWEQAFAYIMSRPDIEDVVISGGDVYFLSARHLREVGETLLAIPHVRRIRFATRGPAVLPMKILSDTRWTDALTDVVDSGRRRCKEVCVHTHFNSPHEITDITRQAMNLLFRRGVTVRNQSVLIRGVNDDAGIMIDLIRQLSYMNVRPYYIYQHDMVSGVEDLRTRVGDTVEIERNVRGAVAGFNTPTFVNDVPGGGGKRDVHSYDHYDTTTGISVYRSPVVNEDAVYLYFDPMHLLPEEGQQRWADEAEHDLMMKEAISAAGLEDLQLA